MLRDGGYLELIATVPGQTSATLDRFLARGPGAHILALEVADEAAALDRLRRAGITGDLSVSERAVDAAEANAKVRFAVILPAEPPDIASPGRTSQNVGRILLIRQLTRDLLWRPDNTLHPNHAAALTEAVYATDAPAEIMTRLSRLSGRPAEPDPLGGYRIILARGRVRILPGAAAAELFPGRRDGGPPLLGLTIATDTPRAAGNVPRVGVTTTAPDGNPIVHAGGVAIRFVAAAN
jgi:hypothetical protein